MRAAIAHSRAKRNDPPNPLHPHHPVEPSVLFASRRVRGQPNRSFLRVAQMPLIMLARFSQRAVRIPLRKNPFDPQKIHRQAGKDLGRVASASRRR
jgi:hypothetical protein